MYAGVRHEWIDARCSLSLDGRYCRLHLHHIIAMPVHSFWVADVQRQVQRNARLDVMGM